MTDRVRRLYTTVALNFDDVAALVTLLLTGPALCVVMAVALWGSVCWPW